MMYLEGYTTGLLASTQIYSIKNGMAQLDLPNSFVCEVPICLLLVKRCTSAPFSTYLTPVPAISPESDCDTLLALPEDFISGYIKGRFAIYKNRVTSNNARSLRVLQEILYTRKVESTVLPLADRWELIV